MLIYTVRQKLSTTWLVSIISFLIMNLFQIGLLFPLPVHTYLLTCETGYWSIFSYVYMTGCVKCHVYFSTFVFANESWFFLCRVLRFIFYWFGMVRRKLTIPERWQAVGMHSGGFSHRRVADHFRVNHSIITTYDWCSVFVKRGMLLTVHVQVDLAKRRRERTGSYPDGRGNGRSVHWCTSW
jgi:hypothetical protein